MPLARGQLAALVLLGDLLLAAAELRLLAALVEVVDQPLHAGLLAVLGLGRRLGASPSCSASASSSVAIHRPFHSGSRFSKNA